jgi:hypothetical protein
LILLSCAGAHSTRRADRVVVSSYPEEIQGAYRVFAIRCSRCHTLARPLNAHITDPQHWIRYVARMRRQPTSGINREDAKTILRFLLYYTRQKQLEAGEIERDTAPKTVTAAPTPERPKAPEAAPEPPAPPAAVEQPSIPEDEPDEGHP